MMGFNTAPDENDPPLSHTSQRYHIFTTNSYADFSPVSMSYSIQFLTESCQRPVLLLHPAELSNRDEPALSLACVYVYGCVCLCVFMGVSLSVCLYVRACGPRLLSLKSQVLRGPCPSFPIADFKNPGRAMPRAYILNRYIGTCCCFLPKYSTNATLTQTHLDTHAFLRAYTHTHTHTQK
jgi:hypothetical protein